MCKIILKHNEPEGEVTERECNSIEEAIRYDYQIWSAIAEECLWYYQGMQLKVDTFEWNVDRVTEEVKKQIKAIDGAKLQASALLKSIPTCALVNELKERLGVTLVSIDPYVYYHILKQDKTVMLDQGPAQILVVID